jgi:hypothetical protein
MFHPIFSHFAAKDAASLLADGSPENTPSPPLDRVAGHRQVGSKGMVDLLQSHQRDCCLGSEIGESRIIYACGVLGEARLPLLQK